VGRVLEAGLKFSQEPRSQSLIYFWCGAVARTWRFNTLSLPIFLGAVL